MIAKEHIGFHRLLRPWRAPGSKVGSRPLRHVGSILKSRDGIPLPVFPPGIDLKREARIARRRFYPVTVLYTAYAILVVVAAARAHLVSTLVFVALGVALWTWVEYMVHRFVLHGRFPDGGTRLRRALHRFFDTMHGDHHLRPWDGMHINGHFDTVPFAVVLALASFLGPLHTWPVLIATVLQCYVIEEWVHYSVHFHSFRARYFTYIRKHHLYHHSPRGRELAFGLTNGIWDAVEGTRVPVVDRQLLYGRRDARQRARREPTRGVTAS